MYRKILLSLVIGVLSNSPWSEINSLSWIFEALSFLQENKNRILARNIYFTELLNDKSGNSMVEYIAYIKKLSKKYHDNVPINKDVLLNLLALIMWEFWISKETLSGPWKDKVKKEIEKKLK